MTYIGIDYGSGISNRDPENPELHYGVISQHTPAYIWDDFEPVYAYGCPECGTEFDEETKPSLNEDLDEVCPSCGYEPKSDDEWYGEEAIDQRWIGEDEYLISYSESLSCFFVEKSPYYTFTRYCSPCAPGAGDLDNPVDDGVKTFALGLDFFDSDIPCPYPIWKVSDDSLVYEKEIE